MANKVATVPEQFFDVSKAISKKVKAIATRIRKFRGDLLAPSLVDAAMEALLKKYTLTEIVEGYARVSHELKCWDHVYMQNEQHFVEQLESIFADVDEEMRAPFIGLFLATDDNGNSLATPAERKSIWDSVGALLRLVIIYIHESQLPVMAPDAAGEIEYKYTLVNEFSEIDIWKYVNAWGGDVDSGSAGPEWDLRSILVYPPSM